LTEPVITINGRALLEPQAKAVRLALYVLRQQIINPMEMGDLLCRFEEMSDLDEGRLTEVVHMLVATPAGDRHQQEKALLAIHKPRRDRILQLAGITPETASARATALAEGYAAQSSLPIDEAAMRLQRAVGEG
jgi:hypothetical protein